MGTAEYALQVLLLHLCGNYIHLARTFVRVRCHGLDRAMLSRHEHLVKLVVVFTGLNGRKFDLLLSLQTIDSAATTLTSPSCGTGRVDDATGRSSLLETVLAADRAPLGLPPLLLLSHALWLAARQTALGRLGDGSRILVLVALQQ